jgi:3-oxoadipate enol-lactonase
VHGGGGNHLSWWQQVPAFSGRYRVITYDQRGYGSSTPLGAAEPEVLTSDLIALLDQLRIERACLVAQSLGGWACLGFTRRWPERVDRLVMCDTHGGLTSPEMSAMWSTTLALAAALPPGVHPAAGERMFRERPDLHFLYVAISELNARTRKQMAEDVRDAGGTPLAEAAQIDRPVLFIEGAEDIVILPGMIELAASNFRRASVSVVPEAGHSVYFERAARFNAILSEFLPTSGDSPPNG